MLLCATLLFLLTSESQVGLFDEGLILTGAFRVLAGELPSRDFLANYGPGQFMALAAAFKLFGANMLVARIYDAVICALVVGVTYAWLARSQPRWLATCCAVCVSGLLIEFRIAGSPVQPCLLLSLAAAFRLSDASFAGAHREALWPVSLALGLLLVFRYDITPLAAGSLALALLAVEKSRVAAGEIKPRPAYRRFAQDAFALGAGPLLAAAILGATGILGAALADLGAYYTMSKYIAIRSLPWPGLADFAVMPLDSAAVYTPAVAVAVGFSTIWRARRRGLTLHSDSGLVTIVVFTLLTAAFFTKGFVRTSGTHMLLANVPACVLVFLCLTRSFAGERSRRTAIRLTALFAGWILLRNGYSAAPLYRVVLGGQTHPDLPALSCFRLEEDRIRAAATIVQLTDPQDRILSATGRHDKVYAVDMAIYFITRRLPATRWHHYDPGVQTTPEVQREIIQDLEREHVRLVMVDLAYDQVQEPNQSALSSGVRELDRYLRAAFQPAAHFGTILVCVRHP